MYHQFEKIGESKIRKELLEYVESLPKDTSWQQYFRGKPLTFETVNAPLDIIEKCDLIMRAYEIEPKKNSKIMRMKPNTYYTPHRDGNRSCSINLLLNNECDSFTFFDNGYHKPMQNDFVELKYEKDSYYLLDSTIEHGVINHNQWRYVFTMGFGISSDNKYNDVLNVLRS